MQSTETRPTRQSGRLPHGRLQNRGGIQKRNGTPARVDRDGDLVMDAATASRAGKSGSGRGASIRGAAAAPRHGTPDSVNSRGAGRPTRMGIDPSAIQKAVLRGMGNTEALPKGPRALNKVLRGSGRGTEPRDGLDNIKISGWQQSKAVSNEDGGIGKLVAFLERKATERSDGPIKIKKSRVEGDALIISVRPEDTAQILKLNSFSFAGAALQIEAVAKKDSFKPRLDIAASPFVKKEEPETASTIDHLKSVLNRRYNAESKLLDLSQLGNDPELVNLGMFNTTSTESKFFPALMKVCNQNFNTAREKDEAIISVSLANNALSDIRSVTTLSQTFPALKNLDLSNNQFKTLSALEAWRWKFRKLEQLVLTGNPLELNEPNYKADILRWYPTLLMLNNEQVRTEQEVKAAATNKLPLPIRGPNFRDEASIAENFVKQFFLGYDGDRVALANAFYDSGSKFSLSINMTAPRSHDHSKVEPWDQYVKRSRNLTKLKNPNAQMSRQHTGSDAIRDCFTTLPATRHPDLLNSPEKWCIECHTIPGLPDPTNQSSSGVGGLIVTVHGEFSEINVSTAQPTATRSFDRSFVLGPGAGPGGIRVANDILVLRAYGGYASWKPDEVEASAIPQGTILPLQQQFQIALPDGFGVPAPGKTEEQTRKEALAVELSRATGMTLEYSGMCLEQSGWDLQEAGVAYQQVKANLPPEAFVGGWRG